MTLAEIQNNGIVGAGGAGFPTHVKLQARPEFIIMNAAECEPLLHKDKALLEHFTDDVIAGMRIAMQITGADNGIIGIKEKHHALIEKLRSRIPTNINLIEIGDFYPAGDEVTLIYLTTGRIVQPGALPASVGCVVQNVETFYNIAVNKPVVEKYLSIAGAVTEPKTIKVPVGMTFHDVLSKFEITVPRHVVRSGGLMMGILETDLNQVVTKTTGALIVLPVDHHCVQMYQRYATEQATIRHAKAACDQCNFCTDLCPRYLLGHPVRPETAMRNRMFSIDGEQPLHIGNAFCCECNLCTLYACPESLDPKGSTVIEKRLAANYPKWEGLPVKAHPMLPYRKVPSKKLKQRLDVLQFNDIGPLSEMEFSPRQVRIPLKQHIGALATPIVRAGETVEKYQRVGEANGIISAHVHASVAGRVTRVTATEIEINGDQ
ncbi:4Fe-4S dicluster domain-containing protein [candidate division KSB1 bacterium]|nr:4Fe-4S dicluster domain-containing protein [candidate division KSB1 bacterium]